jgi:hypothetical protein
MDVSFNFLIQAARVLQVKNYNEKELRMVYNYAVNIDNDILNNYFNNYSILGFENDLILYLEIVDALINIFEELEEYEKCHVLKLKKDESNKIINQKS